MYLTGPPVALSEAFQLIDEVGTAFAAKQVPGYRSYLARIREGSPKPTVGNNTYATLRLAPAVELNLSLMASYDAKGWYVQASVDKSEE
jgi:hypothetical protein